MGSGVSKMMFGTSVLVVTCAIAWVLFARVSSLEMRLSRLQAAVREKCASVEDVYNIVYDAGKSEE